MDKLICSGFHAVSRNRLALSKALSGTGAARRMTTALDTTFPGIDSSMTVLPPNLTMVGLSVRKERPRAMTKIAGDEEPRTMLRKPRQVKIAMLDLRKRSKEPTTGEIRRREKKIKYFSGTGLEVADRLSKSGLPLLRNVLRDGIVAGDFSPAVLACEKRLQSGEQIDHRIVTTMIRTFGSAGELDKAIECKFSAVLKLLLYDFFPSTVILRSVSPHWKRS